MSRVHDTIWFRTGGKIDWSEQDSAIGNFMDEQIMSKGNKKLEKVA